MKVILTEEVRKLGKVGDVVAVKNGYGRNYLIPSGKAILANASNKAELEHHRRVFEARRLKLKRRAEDVADALRAVELKFLKKVGAEDKIFGTVTTAEVMAKLKDAGFDVDKRSIKLPADIKHVGLYTAVISLPSQVSAEVRIHVEAEGGVALDVSSELATEQSQDQDSV
ncbi:MAG: 50S ribosomal protein L9 [Proteobacteria bacterium]|nr:50S ribosomal protein L9 [Pseudomonadota bacterium]